MPNINFAQISNNLKNPSNTIYKIFHKTQKKVPYWLSNILSIKNELNSEIIIHIDTYDGSNQVVHPSVTDWRGCKYLVCTPYPYGIEFYENPSVYCLDKYTQRYVPNKTAFPLIKPEKYGFEHYSDPCIFVSQDRLKVIFRKCERLETGKIDKLLISEFKDGEKWSKPSIIVQSNGDTLISPAVVNIKNAKSDELFCIECISDINSQICKYSLSEQNILSDKVYCDVINLQYKYFIWHIDIIKNNKNKIKGLFMLREKKPYIKSRLAIFVFDEINTSWIFEKYVDFDEKMNKNIKFIYKSTFLNNCKEAICSACDNKNRYFLFKISLN